MDLYIISAIFAAVIISAVIYWLVTRKKKPVTPRNVVVDPNEFYRRSGYYYPNPGASVIEANSGFSEGLIIGSAMSAQQPMEVIVEREVVVTESQPDPPAFEGFGGGDSAGGGATSDWSQPDMSSDSTCSSDSSDSGSSCDSGSSSDS